MQFIATYSNPDFICINREARQERERTETRMLRWMMEIKMIAKIRNEVIRARAAVANTSEKIR